MQTQNRHPATEPTESTAQSLSFLQMVSSILASFFGVQSGKNRERDFALGKARPFILVGVLMTIVWYGTISVIVHFVLKR
ncbi:MAG: DUF2970 domain-containing protein [Spongiibacteraceae bacterium]